VAHCFDPHRADETSGSRLKSGILLSLSIQKQAFLVSTARNFTSIDFVSACMNISISSWIYQSKQMNPPTSQIADTKLITFAVGQQKKSRFQKAREEKELKQKLADEETAKVYDSFVSSFKDDEVGKTFVRGGPNRDSGDSSYGGNIGEVYKIDRRTDRGMSEMERIMVENKV
jgi:hypothetical protein